MFYKKIIKLAKENNNFRQVIFTGKHSQLVVMSIAVFIPAGTKHNFLNTGDKELKLNTVYSPPEHKDGTAHP